MLNVQNNGAEVSAARRGDATFGEIIPGETPVVEPAIRLTRGPIATVEIGVEVKILAKAMIKQIDRVINDLSEPSHPIPARRRQPDLRSGSRHKSSRKCDRLRR